MLGSKKYLDPKYAVLGIFLFVVYLTLVAFDLSVYGSNNNNDDNDNDGLSYCVQVGPRYRGSCFDEVDWRHVKTGPKYMTTEIVQIVK
jgi:hypothetical protein